MQIRESDWKKFKKLKSVALERFCESVLSESIELARRSGASAYDRYVDLYQLLRERDKVLASVFDGLSRSKADLQLGLMYARGIVNDSELSQFSDNTQEIARAWKTSM